MLAKSIHTIETHTSGEPTRIIIGGTGPLPGNSAADKKDYLERKRDDLRKFVIYEPRGHRDMFGAILVEPGNPEADLGVVFMDGGGYLNMCGHGIMGTAVAALETGIIQLPADEQKDSSRTRHLTLETPAGLVRAEVRRLERGWEEVTVSNVPSFVYARDLKVNISQERSIRVDIAFGGSFFALVDAERAGLELTADSTEELSRTGLKIRDRINEKFRIAHPELNYINGVDLVEFYQSNAGNSLNYKNLVVFGQGQFDRSPCGTGTSAKMALLREKDLLQPGDLVESTSIIGTGFTGSFAETVPVGDFTAIKPEITGRAYITGFNHLVLNPEDPLAEGFII